MCLTGACSTLEMRLVNELGLKALKFFGNHSNVAPTTDPEPLRAHCETLGTEMAIQVEDLATQLWFRAQEEAKERRGQPVTDGEARAAMLRAAHQEAEAIVLTEQLYDLLEEPRMSPRVGANWEAWDESLTELEVPWHPDWVDLFEGSPLWLTTRTEVELAAEGFVLDDPWTWWRVFPTPPKPALFLSGPTINRALEDGRLVWDGDTVVPLRRVERLAAEANGAPPQVER